MIIESINERVLYIKDSMDSDDHVYLDIENKNISCVADIFINESQALKIVEHLEKVFGLERNSKTQEA